MKLKQQLVSALLAGVVLTSGVPALAAGAPAGTTPQNTIAVQLTDEEVPLNLVDEEVPLAGDEEVPLAGDEEVPLSSLPDTPFFNALRQLLRMLGWKI